MPHLFILNIKKKKFSTSTSLFKVMWFLFTSTEILDIAL